MGGCGGRGNNCDKNNWRNLSVTFGVDSVPNWISIWPKNPTKKECNTERGRESDSIMETTDFQALKVIDLKCNWVDIFARYYGNLWQLITTTHCQWLIGAEVASRSSYFPLSPHAFELPLSAFSFSIHSGTKAQRAHFVRLVVCFGHWQNSKLPMAN